MNEYEPSNIQSYILWHNFSPKAFIASTFHMTRMVTLRTDLNYRTKIIVRLISVIYSIKLHGSYDHFEG